MHRVSVLVVSLALLPLLAGCVAPDGEEDDLPRLQVETSPDEILAGMELEVHVAFENTNEEDFVINTPEDCLRLEVMARSSATLVPLDDPDRPDCGEGRGEFRVEPGERMEWGPFFFTPGEYENPQGEPHFPPGLFTLRAQFVATQTSWDADGETQVRILEGELPHITIEGEQDAWRQGEEGTIIARFENTSPEPFNFTSRNGCMDIEVHAMNINPDEEYTRLWPAGGAYACQEAITNYTIEPGEEVVLEVVWDGSRDGQGGEPYVDPASYLIRGSFNATRADWATTEHDTVTIQAQEEDGD